MLSIAKRNVQDWKEKKSLCLERLDARIEIHYSLDSFQFYGPNLILTYIQDHSNPKGREFACATCLQSKNRNSNFLSKSERPIFFHRLVQDILKVKSYSWKVIVAHNFPSHFSQYILLEILNFLKFAQELIRQTLS